KMNFRVVAGPPVELRNRLVVDNQSSVRAEVVLPIHGVLAADVEIHFSKGAIDLVVRVKTAGNVRAGCAIGVLSALKLGRQIKNRIARRSIATRIESGNFQAGGAQRTGVPHGVARLNQTGRVSRY